MARKSPQVLTTRQADKYKVDIVETEGFYTILYDGFDATEVRRWPAGGRYYYQLSFMTKLVAEKKAAQFNKEFDTDKFTVREIEPNKKA